MNLLANARKIVVIRHYVHCVHYTGVIFIDREAGVKHRIAQYIESEGLLNHMHCYTQIRYTPTKIIEC